MIKRLAQKVLEGRPISKEDALRITKVSGTEIFELFASANRVREYFMGDKVGLCSIVNAKSGGCPEDCAFCAQSCRSKATVEVYPLVDKKIVIQKAKVAKQSGAKRFSVVSSGRKTSGRDLKSVADMISEIRAIGLIPCASLGMVSEKELSILKSAGLKRYHHNLETSERFFPHICGSHSFADKIKTIAAVKTTGLSLCSGGIFGIGETWQDRIDMAIILKELNVDSVPINFLIPIKGTVLGSREFLHPFEALKIVSLYRFILPQKEIRICGGRMQVLREFNSMVFFAGADGLLSGDYLTTSGSSYEDDLRLIDLYGLTI